MIRLIRDHDYNAALTISVDLTEQEQRMIFTTAAAMISSLPAELGHPLDATYGVPETKEL